MAQTPEEADRAYERLGGSRDHVPHGHVCYTRTSGWKQDRPDGLPYFQTQLCPYWAHHPDKPKQDAGYCALLRSGDWEEGIGILWDQVKQCDVNLDDPEEYEGEREPG